MRKLLIGLSSAALLVAAPAFAQTTQNPEKPKPQVQGNQPPVGNAPVQQKRLVGQPRTSDTQARVQWTPAKRLRASKLIGTPIVNTKRESIGDVDEIIIGGDGKVTAVIVGVGGFLGFGERRIALKMNELKLMTTRSGSRLIVKTELTRAELEGRPAWQMK